MKPQPQSSNLTQDAGFNPVTDSPVTENLNKTQYFGGEPDNSNFQSQNSTTTTSYKAPPFDDFEEVGNNQFAGNGNNHVNETASNEMPDEKSSEALAEMGIAAYELMLKAGAKLVEFKHHKLEELHKKGKIDLKIPVAYENGKPISKKEYVEKFNAEISKAVAVDDDFKQKVIPLLSDILKENNLGITKMQQVGLLFAGHFIGASSALYQIYKLNSSTINGWMEEKENINNTQTSSTTSNSANNNSKPSEPEEKNQDNSRSNAQQQSQNTHTTNVKPNVTVIPPNEPKKRGRKMGQKNKPKEQPVEDAVVLSEQKNS